MKAHTSWEFSHSGSQRRCSLERLMPCVVSQDSVVFLLFSSSRHSRCLKVEFMARASSVLTLHENYHIEDEPPSCASRKRFLVGAPTPSHERTEGQKCALAFFVITYILLLINKKIDTIPIFCFFRTLQSPRLMFETLIEKQMYRRLYLMWRTTGCSFGK